MENISQKNIELSNSIIAIMHLKDASDLLKNEQPELSYLLLETVKTLMEQTGLVNEDIKNIESTISDISSNNG